MVDPHLTFWSPPFQNKPRARAERQCHGTGLFRSRMLVTGEASQARCLSPPLPLEPPPPPQSF